VQKRVQSVGEGADHHRWTTHDDVGVDHGGCCFVEVATCALVHLAENETTSGQVGVWVRRGAIEAAQEKLRGRRRTQRREGAVAGTVRTLRRSAFRELGRRESFRELGRGGLTTVGRGYAACKRLTTILGLTRDWPDELSPHFQSHDPFDGEQEP
jgi:hypothetical protein